MCIDEHTHTVRPLCTWHMLHFSAHSLKIICHLAFLSRFLSLVFYWLFNRKQRQQPQGRRWKTTAMLWTQLSTNVLSISSLPFKRPNSRSLAVFLAQRKCESKSTNLYLVCSTAAKHDLCSFPCTIGFEPKSFTLSSQDINKFQQLREIKFVWWSIEQPLAFTSRERRFLSEEGNHWLELGTASNSLHQVG